MFFIFQLEKLIKKPEKVMGLFLSAPFKMHHLGFKYEFLSKNSIEVYLGWAYAASSNL